MNILQGMGLRELREIQTTQDFNEYQPEELLEIIRGAVKEFDERVGGLEEKLSWAVQQIALLSHRLFGDHSEKTPKDEIPKDDKAQSETGIDSDQPVQESGSQDKPAKNKKIQKPSERYPNLKIFEEDILSNPPPCCPICQAAMEATGMTEDSESLHVIPKQFVIIRKKRAKYACGGCHGSLITAKAPPSILPGIGYSDDLITDVVLNKYCDLIPIGRYAAIAGRQGAKGIPPHSLIEGTHHLAKLLLPIYMMIRMEVLIEAVLAADETTHRMLEGSHKKRWYLWGFSSRESVFYETHSTRSGDVASSILVDSKCEVLLSDVYSGYEKAVREANEIRKTKGLSPIVSAFCNAHSRRRYKELGEIAKQKAENEAEDEELLDAQSSILFPGDYDYFLEQYREIYRLEDQVRGKSLEVIGEQREKMTPYFEGMKAKCAELKDQYPNKHLMSKAMNYFTNNYEGLTRCLSDARIPLDNNQQESRFRNPVVGRKTWLGTHSILGAKTAAVHFTLVESCKLIEINPREYYKAVITDLLNGGNGFTPLEWKKRSSAPPPTPESGPPGPIKPPNKTETSNPLH